VIFGVLAAVTLLVPSILVLFLVSLLITLLDPTLAYGPTAAILAYISMCVVGALIVWKVVRHWNDIESTKTMFSRLAAVTLGLAIILAIVYITTPLIMNIFGGSLGVKESTLNCQSSEGYAYASSSNNICCLHERPLCQTSQAGLGGIVMLCLSYGIDIGLARLIGPRLLK
jgi:hypothetical protein